jgi:hypothetical protein
VTEVAEVHDTPTQELMLPMFGVARGAAPPEGRAGSFAALEDRAGNVPEALGRFVDLMEAVRDHESAASNRAVPKRPGDHRLYRRLDEIEGLDPDQATGSNEGRTK